MTEKRPRGREKYVSGQKGSVKKRGDGLNTGPVGSGGRTDSGLYQNRSGSRGKGPLPLIALILLLLLGGGGIGSQLLGGSSSSDSGTSFDLSTLMGMGSGTSGGNGNVCGQWIAGSNTGSLNTKVADSARAKRTVIKGDHSDQITLMVYMCGADLESHSAMATYDLQEMAAAAFSQNINLIVYTGGASQWHNNTVSSQVNQIYQVTNGGLKCLVKNAGTQSMTDPNTLTDFIRYCTKNFPANRQSLIFWDHGGGSVTGYGYDENYPRSGSMSLSGIDQALKKADVFFDFIGFDACLMATVETALMLDNYADYLIASEETEPGVGWYYTEWLKKLSDDPSMSTLSLGKNIADDFVAECSRKCPGQKTTLSVIDLAEAASTIPAALADFSRTTTEMIRKDQYQLVSNARDQSREFAQSSAIDQIDFVHLAKNLGTDDGDALADALLGAVKYNMTSSNMTNAYGLSVYFPFRKLRTVDNAVNTYHDIGMDSEYTKCIQAFASVEASGQAASGGTSSPLPMLMGTLLGSDTSTISSDVIGQLIASLASGQLGTITGLTSDNTGFMDNKSLTVDDVADYIADNQLNSSKLTWSDDKLPVLNLHGDDWDLIQDLALNVFFDDGSGYIDLGLDNVFTFTDDGDLSGMYDGTWLAVNGQPVAYYYETTVDDGTNYTITGHIPALLNGDRVNLLLVFDNDHPRGQITGSIRVYTDGETETIAKTVQSLQPGDTLDFLCDYYSYDGSYQDSYLLGDQMIVGNDIEISNVPIDGSFSATYRLTDIYQQHYWTEVIPD